MPGDVLVDPGLPTVAHVLGECAPDVGQDLLAFPTLPTVGLGDLEVAQRISGVTVALLPDHLEYLARRR